MSSIWHQPKILHGFMRLKIIFAPLLFLFIPDLFYSLYHLLTPKIVLIFRHFHISMIPSPLLALLFIFSLLYIPFISVIDWSFQYFRDDLFYAILN